MATSDTSDTSDSSDDYSREAELLVHTYYAKRLRILREYEEAKDVNKPAKKRPYTPYHVLAGEGVSELQRVLKHRRDSPFRSWFGVSVHCFDELLILLQKRYLLYTPYGEGNGTFRLRSVKSQGKPRTIPARLCLAMTLFFMRTSVTYDHIAGVSGTTRRTVDTYVRFGMGVLLAELKVDDRSKVRTPTIDEMEGFSDAISRKYPTLRGCFGFVDGMCIRVVRGMDDDIQAAYYNGYKKAHVINNVLAFTPDGCCFWYSVNAPGTVADVTIFNRSNLARYLRHILPPDTHFFIAADAGFQVFVDTRERIHDEFSGTTVNPYMVGPLRRRPKKNELQPQSDFEREFFDELGSARVSIEWANGVVKNTFGRLYGVLPHNFMRRDLIELALHLVNFKSRLEGDNELYKVFYRE